MAVRVDVSVDVERPVSVVFNFYADGHVRNHPRWDPDIELQLDDDAPIGVGTTIRRRNSRMGTPVEDARAELCGLPGDAFAEGALAQECAEREEEGDSEGRRRPLQDLLAGEHARIEPAKPSPIDLVEFAGPVQHGEPFV